MRDDLPRQLDAGNAVTFSPLERLTSRVYERLAGRTSGKRMSEEKDTVEVPCAQLSAWLEEITRLRASASGAPPSVSQSYQGESRALERHESET